MPNMPSGSSSQYSQIESKIAEALISVCKRPDPNLAEIARQFDVPYYRLRRRFLGKPSRSTRKPAGKKLTNFQESEVLNRISQLDHHSIKRIANQILERDHVGYYPPPTVGYKWCQRFIKHYTDQFRGEFDFQLRMEELAKPAGLAAPSTVQGLNVASTSKMIHVAGMTNAHQMEIPANSSKEAQSRQAHDIPNDLALEVALDYSNFEPAAVTSGHLTAPSQTLIQASTKLEHSFVTETHISFQRPRDPGSDDSIIRQSTRTSLDNPRARAAPFGDNEFACQPNYTDVRKYFSDPHLLSPPQVLLVPENLFYDIKVYFENSCRQMNFDKDGNLLTPNGAKWDNTLCNDFDSYCFTATLLIGKGLHAEFRRALSKASALVEQILQVEHPRTLACFLEVFIHLLQNGLPEVTSCFCDYIKEMSAKVIKKGHPWGRICRLLGELDMKHFEQAMAQIWKCTADIFDRKLGTFSRLAVSLRLDYIKRVVTDHLEEERLLRDLLSQFGGIPRLSTPRVMLNLAHNWTKQGRHDEAEEMALEALSLLQRCEMYTARIAERIESLKIISRSHFYQGQAQAAEQTMREAIGMIVDQWGIQHHWVPEFMNVLEGWLRLWDRNADADTLRGEIEELMGKDEIDP
ncbi:hypothetical protein Purlil1_13795 [Purpureocillium lilacinum]|uniref:Clr5 domain-containing protein n=1 Tax=Purpureocillium lilacinum TaxID=33203 RepID=A0ABR0BD31_PURLI|nr:hypothetical protein Purlil1_13795 [Purpureocillium lilacinum]